MQSEIPRKEPAAELIDLTSDTESDAPSIVPERSVDGDRVAASEDRGATDQPRRSEGDESEDDEWGTESLYADALQGMAHGPPLEPPEDACSLEEANAYRKDLRRLGPDKFLEATVKASRITAKRLCTAFEIRLPPFLEGAPDGAYYSLLNLGITRELSKRIKLPQYNTVDDAISLLEAAKNIIVLTGAGISTSLGIPDFRSKDTGLYSRLEHLGLGDPQEVFDIDLFREDPSIFYSIAKDIFPSTNKFSPTHAFIRLLQDKQKLLTNYSQNIDDLESKTGILPEKLIQCHGSFASATCLTCGHKVKCQEIYAELKQGKISYCPQCTIASKDAKLERKRRRATGANSNARKKRPSADSDSEDETNDGHQGVMKPDITFFGEALPRAFDERLEQHDRDVVDLVIVIGTSLKVAPVSNVVGFLPANVPQIYISREPVSHVEFDIELLGDCDIVVAELCRRAGWRLKHEMIPDDQKVDVELIDGYQSRYALSARNR